MMVARHEMPGTADKRTCPGGYGMTRAPGFGHRPRRSDAFGKPDHTLPLQHPQSATADAIRTGRGTQIPRSAQIRARARALTPNAKRLVLGSHALDSGTPSMSASSRGRGKARSTGRHAWRRRRRNTLQAPKSFDCFYSFRTNSCT